MFLFCSPWFIHGVFQLDVSMMMMPGSFYGATVVILSWVAGSLTQPAVKRAAAIALINAVCNTPNSAC
jgi:hypothetical protein